MRKNHIRTISIARLNSLRNLHLQPINLVVSQGAYKMRKFILWLASRLDAFSGYPFPA